MKYKIWHGGFIKTCIETDEYTVEHGVISFKDKEGKLHMFRDNWELEEQ